MSAGFLIGNSDDSKTDKSQSYSNSTDSGQSDRLLESQQDCTAHISKVKSLQRKVYILVLLFSLLLILYIGTSVYIITTLAHLQEDSNLLSQASSAQGVIDTNTHSQSEYRFCINEADITKFGDTWKKMDHLKSKGDVCFKTFSWFPQITNLVSSQSVVAIILYQHIVFSVEMLFL